MMTLLRAEERHHEGGPQREAWRTFGTHDNADRISAGFGVLEMLNEERLPPGTAAPSKPSRDAEIITWVREGALTWEDSNGGSGVLYSGEVQRMTAQSGVRHRESNASRSEGAHVFQIWLRASEAGLELSRECKRFSAAQRRKGLCVIASPDARRGSLRLHPDALVYSAVLGYGQHTIHELSSGRSVWLHVVQGEVSYTDAVLTAGDGVGVTGERGVSFTAREESEVLLLDLGGLPSL